jgi:hypothetical protein
VTSCQRICWLLVFIVTCVLPASANNPPQPDGVFSVLLIFPVILIGMRLADARPDPKSKRRPVLTGLLLALAFIITLAGDEIGGLGLLMILVYGLVRGGQIMQRGKGRKAWVVGTIVILWVLFAGVDYIASVVSSGPSSTAVNESLAVSRLRKLSTAEATFAKEHSSSSEAEPTYATIAELQKEGLIDYILESGQVRNGYRYGEILELSKRQILFYALPTQAQPSQHQWRWIFPGASLFPGFLKKKESDGTGIRSFAVDETGIIRWSVRPAGTPVTREEFMRWEKLQ